MVCVGNICRSPIAEALWNARLGDEFSSRCSGSAGLMARLGDPVHPFSVELLERNGVNLPEGGATPWSQIDPKAWDLILTMESRHREEIEQRSPVLRGRVFTLGHWSGFEVPDPMGRPMSAFEEAYELIDQGVGDWFKRLGYDKVAA